MFWQNKVANTAKNHIFTCLFDMNFFYTLNYQGSKLVTDQAIDVHVNEFSAKQV